MFALLFHSLTTNVAPFVQVKCRLFLMFQESSPLFTLSTTIRARHSEWLPFTATTAYKLHRAGSVAHSAPVYSNDIHWLRRFKRADTVVRRRGRATVSRPAACRLGWATELSRPRLSSVRPRLSQPAGGATGNLDLPRYHRVPIHRGNTPPLISVAGVVSFSAAIQAGRGLQWRPISAAVTPHRSAAPWRGSQSPLERRPAAPGEALRAPCPEELSPLLERRSVAPGEALRAPCPEELSRP